MIANTIKTAFNNLRSTTLRTILAMLGILVGTAAVVAMVSTGQMATDEALKEFKALGTELMAVSLSNKDSAEEKPKKFDLQAALKMQNVSSDIKLIAPYALAYGQIAYRGNILSGGIIGATASLAKVVNINMLMGRFISPFDDLEKYCVIGFEIYQKIKPFVQNPINTRINLGDHVFVIVGVADYFRENSFLYQDINTSVIIPIQATGFLSDYDISNIIMRLGPNTNILTVKKSIEEYVKINASTKEIFFRSAQELIKSMEAQHQIFTLLLSLIGSISLVVGGIGVMNIMLVSVLERRREIGIRLALGARGKEIQWMFLAESVLLSVIGGVLGVITGVLSSFIIAVFLKWKFELLLLPPLIGFTVSVLIGVFFGYYPAKKASQLDPIQTLRAE